MRYINRLILTYLPNVTAHTPTGDDVPITVFLYDGPLLCGFNLAIKGLNFACPLQQRTNDAACSLLTKAKRIHRRQDKPTTLTVNAPFPLLPRSTGRL